MGRHPDGAQWEDPQGMVGFLLPHPLPQGTTMISGLVEGPLRAGAPPASQAAGAAVGSVSPGC